MLRRRCCGSGTGDTRGQEHVGLLCDRCIHEVFAVTASQLCAANSVVEARFGLLRSADRKLARMLAQELDSRAGQLRFVC